MMIIADSTANALIAGCARVGSPGRGRCRSSNPAEKRRLRFQWRGERIDDCNTLAFQNAVKAAKVEPLRWHDLRHTWAAWAVQSGVSLHELMLLGGWRSFSMVLRYSHFAPHHLARAAAKIRLKLRTKIGTPKGPAGESLSSR